MRKQRMICCMFMMALILCSQIVLAQEFPTKTIILVNPGGPGGSTDLTMRAVTSVSKDYLGHPIIVELKGGGGGAIGSDFAAKAAPDGYTLLAGGPGWSSTLPAVEGRSKGPDDLVAVCRINYSAGMLLTRPDQPFKTLKEMIDWAKANPGKLVFGNSGPWGAGDVDWKEIKRQTGIVTREVTHDGGGPAMLALLGGQVQVIGNLGAQSLPHIKAGKLVPLAVLDTKRDPEVPNVPTAIEQGVTLVDVLWRGVLAPKGTPRPIIDKLALAFKKMCEDKSVITMIKQFGDDIHYLGPDEFTKIWREEFEARKELGKLYKK
jgi:tripartite-type tricarboxylate transporter receptor subunit TctC